MHLKIKILYIFYSYSIDISNLPPLNQYNHITSLDDHLMVDVALLVLLALLELVQQPLPVDVVLVVVGVRF